MVIAFRLTFKFSELNLHPSPFQAESWCMGEGLVLTGGWRRALVPSVQCGLTLLGVMIGESLEVSLWKTVAHLGISAHAADNSWYHLLLVNTWAAFSLVAALL